MLPVRPLRAALLAFVSALALVEVGAGLIVGQAWRLVNSGEISATQRADLNAMLERLRVMENVVIAGALATTVLWSIVAVYNATVGARGGRRDGMIGAIACVAGPVLFLALRAAAAEEGTARLVMVGAQAIALYLPFWAVGRVAEGVGGPRMPFLRWYLALAGSFVVHDLFTTKLDLGNPQQSDDFGRTAIMFLVNGLVVAVMAVMAAEATRAMDRATSERALTHRLLHDDANRRERPSSIAFEQPASTATPTSVPSLPPAPGSMPTLPAHAQAAPMVAPVLGAAMVSTAVLTPPHPQPAIGEPMAPPSVPVVAPVATPVVQAPVAPAQPFAAPLVARSFAAPVVEPPSREVPMVAVPPAATPALTPLGALTPLAHVTPVAQVTPLTPAAIPVTAAPESSPATTATPMDEPLSAALPNSMPSMFQPLKRSES
jgi:hypothetical protein